jgi:hypothetical protein
MYPVSLGYNEARRRIQILIENGHLAEALLTSVFTFEKTYRRALRYCVIARGFTSKQTNVLLKQKSFRDLMELWQCFSPNNERFPAMMGLHHQKLIKAIDMRNKLVHGNQVFTLEQCATEVGNVLDALDTLRDKLTQNINYDGWTRLPVRTKSRLEWHRFSRNSSGPQSIKLTAP